jgi:alkanesulfonate monooxygenase SsuD/methylene tetrahydromethanopterin reductase-like flavin-dependent oxidoreductase (luciferase family)
MTYIGGMKFGLFGGARLGPADPLGDSCYDQMVAADDAALIGTPEEIVEKLRQLAARGVEYVLLSNATANRKSLEVFAGEIMPHVARAPARAGLLAI